MIRVYEKDNWWIRLEHIECLKHRYFLPYGAKNGAILEDRYFEWMTTNNIFYIIGYDICYPLNQWYIQFENNEDAVLFKLTWG